MAGGKRTEENLQNWAKAFMWGHALSLEGRLRENCTPSEEANRMLYSSRGLKSSSLDEVLDRCFGDESVRFPKVLSQPYMYYSV
jgi:hypothetical protein